jgi:hypothetical protein
MPRTMPMSPREGMRPKRLQTGSTGRNHDEASPIVSTLQATPARNVLC